MPAKPRDPSVTPRIPPNKPDRFMVNSIGELDASWDYLHFRPGEDDVRLDGSFTLADLEWIVAYVKANP